MESQLPRLPLIAVLVYLGFLFWAFCLLEREDVDVILVFKIPLPATWLPTLKIPRTTRAGSLTGALGSLGSEQQRPAPRAAAC